MIKKILCWLGIHDWHGEVIDGMTFKVCAGCKLVKPWGECED